MATFKCEPGAEINGVDQAGNVWPEPFVFDSSGLLTVPDDQQDVISALLSSPIVSLAKKPKE